MLNSCAIFGDSIAVGLSWFIKSCAVTAKVGMSSGWILAHAYSGNFDTVYVSAGSNDPSNPSLFQNLEGIRQKNPNAKYVWILPVNYKASLANKLVANMYHDRTVSFTPGPDHVHPRSYQELSKKVY